MRKGDKAPPRVTNYWSKGAGRTNDLDVKVFSLLTQRIVEEKRRNESE